MGHRLGRGVRPWRRWGLIGGLGWALALGLGGTAFARVPCEVSPESAMQGAVSRLSPRLAQDLCQMVMMPTVARSESDRFSQQIQPDSLRTDTSVSADRMTLPSLWWTRDSLPNQVGRHRLVDAWFSYRIQGTDVQVVDIMINSQFWRALTLHQRYGILAQFGHTAQEFGYHLRFVQSNGYSARMIGLYACEASPSPPAGSPAVPPCLITVDTTRIAEIQRAMQTPATQTATGPSLGQAEAVPTALSTPQTAQTPAMTNDLVLP
ncbi:MAG: hypothetical protein VKI82_14250 [Leptolyngbya sp.]|nr:hypothetical protein [Leptolyngbya sp.]